MTILSLKIAKQINFKIMEWTINFENIKNSNCNFNLKYKEYFLIIGISLIMIWQLFPSEINFFYTTLIITLATCLIIISFFPNIHI